MIEQQNSDYNLTSAATIYNKTATVNGEYDFRVRVGDGTKNLNTAEAMLTLTITVGGQTINFAPVEITKAAAVLRGEARTGPVYVAADEAVTITLLSDNANDTDVDVTVDPILLSVNATQISGDAAAADNLEAMLDGTGGVTLNLSQIKLSCNVSGQGALDARNSHATGYGIYAGGTTGIYCYAGASGYGIRARGALYGASFEGYTGLRAKSDDNVGFLVEGR